MEIAYAMQLGTREQMTVTPLSRAIGASAGIVIALVSSPLYCQSSGSPTRKPEKMQCLLGPLAGTFGGGPWLVYACDDGRSVVVVTEQHNPASPFYFLVSPGGGAHRVAGEGSGNKAASDAAGDELSKMSDAKIADLWSRARAAGRAAQR
jgi:hypothetical protein